MSGAGAQPAAHARPGRQPEKRSPLAYLLHALNQPLTGLQCSLELAVLGPRSTEQYRHTLEGGLDLIARMRVLVEALRELADIREKSMLRLQEFELAALVSETVEGLRPAADAKEVRLHIVADGPARLRAEAGMTARLFRLLDASLSLAQRESEMTIESTCPGGEICLAVSWVPGPAPEHSPFSRPELGLLIAGAEWESAGAAWSRLRHQGREICAVRFVSSAPSTIGELP